MGQDGVKVTDEGIEVGACVLGHVHAGLTAFPEPHDLRLQLEAEPAGGVMPGERLNASVEGDLLAAERRDFDGGEPLLQ